MATTPMTTPDQVTDEIATKCQMELEAYIDSHAEPDDISFASFVQDRSAFIIENSDPQTEYKEFWSNLFGRVARKNRLQSVKNRVDWSVVDSALGVSGSSTTQAHTPSSSAVTSQKSTGSQLTTLQKLFIEKNFASLPRPKWELPTGKVVEDVMKKFCEECKTEHPAHSLLLDLNDSIWVRFFSSAELSAMRMHNVPCLPDLPVDLKEYLNRYKGKHDLEELTAVNMAQCFHPKRHPSLHWAHRAIGDVLDLYHYKYDINRKTESDLVRRLWGFIEKCFDESVFEIISGEKASSSSSERKNDDRSISGIEELSRKAVGHKVDILIKYLEDEYGCAEAGLVGGLKSTKYIKEATLKVPKTLRDMLWKISKASPESVDKVCLPGFVINGTTMEIKLIDVPEGNICRITTLGPLHFPLEAPKLYKFFVPLLTIVWQVRTLLEKTLTIIQNDESIFVPTIITPSPQPSVPACIPSPTPRKRKLSDTDI